MITPLLYILAIGAVVYFGDKVLRNLMKSV